MESTETISFQNALIDNGKITVSGQTGKNEKPLTRDTLYGKKEVPALKEVEGRMVACHLY